MLLTRTSESMITVYYFGPLTIAGNRSTFDELESICSLEGKDLPIGKLGHKFWGPVRERPLRRWSLNPLTAATLRICNKS
jgi:hypothetical protein